MKAAGTLATRFTDPPDTILHTLYNIYLGVNSSNFLQLTVITSNMLGQIISVLVGLFAKFANSVLFGEER